MNRKKLFYVFIILLFSLSFYFLGKSSVKPRLMQTTKTEPEVMLAPAFIDSASDLTRIATLQSGVITSINVLVGQKVSKGQLLYSIDNHAAKSAVKIQKIALYQAKNGLLIAEKDLKHSRHQLKNLQAIDKRAISQAELRAKKDEVEVRELQFAQAKRNLELVHANLKNAQLILQQYQAVSPKDGIVLQINAHLNEFVGQAQPIMLLGDAEKVMVRVAIDERDVFRFVVDDTAYMTSDIYPNIKIPLTFVQMDKIIIYQDRLNARVQEALYYFNRKDYPELAAGQQFNAYLSAKTTV